VQSLLRLTLTLNIPSGRTGRFGRQGVAINFISDADSYRWVQELQQDLGVEITAVKTQDYEEMEKVLFSCHPTPGRTF
jgi:superfamily II DNA/RNA helicase